jgi:hypothetical protein
MFRSLLKALQYSHLYTALATFGFTMATYFMLPLRTNLAIVLTNFFGTLFIYNCQSLVYIAKPLGHLSEAKVWQQQHKKTIWFILFLSLIWLPELIKVFSSNVLLLYGLAGTLAILYYLPILGLRRIPLLKNILLGFVWTVVCVVIPVFQSEAQLLPLVLNVEETIGLPIQVVLYYLFSFLLIVLISFWFDYRDMAIDELNTSKTLVNQMPTKTFLKWFVLIGAIVLSLLVALNTVYWLVVLGLFLYLFYLIVRVRSQTLSFLAYGFLGDGVLLLYVILIYINQLIIEWGPIS